jgi:para-aminobenzoate synthetase component 1
MVEQLNKLGKERTPFFFCISYDKSEFIIHPLDALPDTILYSFEQTAPATNDNIKSFLIPSPIDFHEYKKGFDLIMENLQQGNTYLLNYTCATPIKSSLPLEEIYDRSQAPFKLFIKNQFLISSPERFIKISNNTIETFPMKGTIDALTQESRDTLLADEKESSEHLMVVDLLRNDLSMVASGVKVQSYRYTHHIHAGEKELIQTSSHITGKLDTNWNEHIGTILDTLLPAGSITGAPKRSTCEIIHQAEIKPRGFYTGVFGIFDGKNLDSAVSIRFIKETKNGLEYHSGGGITLLSDPHAEYQEMLKKIYVPID